ncbi:MAG: NUDIX domain-containing protein [Zavarzinella sp.]
MLKLVRQAAVVPIFNNQVVIITSRSGQRWVLPKGNIEREQTSQQAAEMEAWEEAGITGKISEVALGSFCEKKNEKLYHITVYTMTVVNVSERWPEAKQRVRKLVNLDEVDSFLQSSDMCQFVQMGFRHFHTEKLVPTGT